MGLKFLEEVVEDDPIGVRLNNPDAAKLMN